MGDLTDQNGFIPVDSLLTKKTLDPSLESISDFVKRVTEGTGAFEDSSASQAKSCLYPQKCSPPSLAEELAAAADATLDIVERLHHMLPQRKPELDAELTDLSTWAHLGKYFALKIRGTVAYGLFRNNH